jgi:cell division septation protein DedD
MALGQSAAEAMRQTLKDKGFPVMLTPGRNSLTRVLVGPYSDTATLGRAKTDLENAGMHPVMFKREQ